MKNKTLFFALIVANLFVVSQLFSGAPEDYNAYIKATGTAKITLRNQFTKAYGITPAVWASQNLPSPTNGNGAPPAPTPLEPMPANGSKVLPPPPVAGDPTKISAIYTLETGQIDTAIKSIVAAGQGKGITPNDTRAYLLKVVDAAIPAE